MPYRYSAGVALGDLDHDGDLDAFVVNSYNVSMGAFEPNRIYTNKIDKRMGFTVADITALPDRDSQGVALGDLDNDGNLDAFVVNNNEANRIYTNDRMGTGSFTAADIPTTLPGRSSQGVALGDLDGDGDLDAFVVNNNQPNRIYTNDGKGNFTVADIPTGDDRNSAGVALADLDRDGDLDAFVVNSGEASRIYTNDGKGNFTASDVSGDMGASTGVGLGDLGLDRD